MPSVTLQPDAADGKDTQVVNSTSGTPPENTRNYGISNYIRIRNTANGLIKFDCSSVPATATCTTATLSLTHILQEAALAFTAYVYSIASGNADWPAGTKDNTLGVAGDSCWLYKDQTPGAETAWAGGAGLSMSGTDYEASSIGNFSGNRSDVVGTVYNASLTTARVQGWFGVVNTNYGVLLKSANPVERVAASDHATAAYRPKLVVEYELPGSGGIFASSIFHSAIMGATLTR